MLRNELTNCGGYNLINALFLSIQENYKHKKTKECKSKDITNDIEKVTII